MDNNRFERLKEQKTEEAKKFFDEYNVEGTTFMFENIIPQYPFYNGTKDNDIKTIKLSNSTNPIPCY